MAWWHGEGAARVLEQDDDTVLLERVVGHGSLIEMAQSGQDSEASEIICAVAAELHARRPRPIPDLIPLARWFSELTAAASRCGGVLTRSLQVSRELLNKPLDVVVLHGDLHHGNVLDGGRRGWLAIDPKGLLGERGFDFANIFCNPDLDTAAAPGRLAKQATAVAQAAHLDRHRLLKWILAYAGLSASWSLGEADDDPHWRWPRSRPLNWKAADRSLQNVTRPPEWRGQKNLFLKAS
jgi:streptomycin 6-kinase